ncbi:MAG: YfjI family protein [Actinomycetota bacterium]|nr:YfjI family protein [Actinomycetota bacterium]
MTSDGPLPPNVLLLRPEGQEWPDPVSSAAFHGLAGEVATMIEPHSESDPVAILAQFLVAFGSCIGTGPHYAVEATHHGANEFVVLVGSSAKARKGSSWDHVARIFAQVDPAWSTSRVVSGLSSGEGLIWRVRDSVEGKDETADKRLLVLESEFASVLKSTAREGNTLSPVVRNAWDHKVLQALTKNSPAIATGAHISIVGHITRDELLRWTTATELANGFLNRFMLFAVRRSKLLPEGGSIDALHWDPLLARLRAALDHGRSTRRFRLDDQARRRWWAIYPELSAAGPGLLGAVTARAEAHVVRLALIYALLDRAEHIGVAHIDAALALWAHAQASAEWVFGDSLGDPIADEIWRALRDEPAGLTRTDIRDLFGRNRRSRDIDAALGSLSAAGRVDRASRQDRGRPAELWRARA